MTSVVSGVPVSECFLDDVPMSDWERLGRYVIARRVELGFRQRPEFSAAVGITSRVISDIENGRRSNFDPVTIAALEKALGWETGSVHRVAAGGEPLLVGEIPDFEDAAAPARANDEIEMIYRSRSMSPKQKLEAIRMVLHLRAQVEADTDPANGAAAGFDAPVETNNGG